MEIGLYLLESIIEPFLNLEITVAFLSNLEKFLM